MSVPLKQTPLATHADSLPLCHYEERSDVVIYKIATLRYCFVRNDDTAQGQGDYPLAGRVAR